MRKIKKKLTQNKCCSWDTFFTGCLCAAKHLSIPLLILNRCQLRRDWRKGLTGFEAVKMQHNELLKETYLSYY